MQHPISKPRPIKSALPERVFKKCVKQEKYEQILEKYLGYEILESVEIK